MPATVGATITGGNWQQIPLRNAGLGPFISSAGNVYVVGRGGAGGAVVVMKSTDPISGTWAEQNSTSAMAAGGTFEAIAAAQQGDILHLVGQITTGFVDYKQFSMATDLYTAPAGSSSGEQAAAASSFAPATNATFCSIVVRSNGNAVIGYCGGQTAMTSGFHSIKYVVRTAANTYSTVTGIDIGGSVNWVNPLAVLGASDRVHFFFKDNTNSDAYQRTLSAANALQGFPASGFDVTAVTTTTLHPFGPGVSGSTVVVPYADSSGRTSIASLTSADAPTLTTSADVGDVVVKTTNAQSVHTVSTDGSTRHLLYSDTTASDLQHANDGGTGTWSADTNELAATINAISANVYTRGGSTVLAMVIDDGGTAKYAEINLSGAPPATTSLAYDPYSVYRKLSAR